MACAARREGGSTQARTGQLLSRRGFRHSSVPPVSPFAGAFDLAVSFGALGHFLPGERPALFAGVHRALRPGGVFAFPIGAAPPITAGQYWALLGFDLAMRVRNAVWRPPFVMYYRTCSMSALSDDLTASGFAVTTLPLTALGQRGDGSPRARLVLARKASAPS
jgi:SAM-dependent methyltransferase